MFEDKSGQRIPEVSFPTLGPEGLKPVTTESLFAGKTVIVFSLPGAFTPTCSTSHVPRFNELAHVFKANGVDDILCVSVNDTFVMTAWQKAQDAGNLTFVADGNGEFSEGMGLLVDKSQIGFGKRSWRYSMLVKDGVIDKMFIEPNVPGDPYEVSDADTMLKYVAPDAELPKDIVLFTKPGCSHCGRAKDALTAKQITFSDVPADLALLRAVSGNDTTPQVFIGGKHIGGADELLAHLSK
jgi:peroxiredoxin/glutaredoxin